MLIPLPPDRPIALDELEPSALGREVALDNPLIPAFGWFLLVLSAFDLMGNLVGPAG